MFQSVTVGINFIGLMATIWLGLYLGMHSLRRPGVWLSVLALWSIGGYFLNQLLALFPPPAPSANIRVWLYHLMLFWPRDVFEIGWKGWLLGWLPVYSLAFWYHATLYMLPGSFTRNRQLGAMLGYVAAMATILLNAHNRELWLSLFEDPLYVPAVTLPIFALFAAGFIFFAGLSIINLRRAARSSPASFPSTLFRQFVFALLLAGTAGLFTALSSFLKTPIPQVLPAFCLLLALVLAGFGVIQYTTSLTLRPLLRSLLYSAVEVSVILALYLLILRTFFRPSPSLEILYVLTACLAVLSYPLIDLIRLRLDWQYFQSGSRELARENASNGNNEIQAETVGQPVIMGEISVRDVELALRNLHHYTYLADSPLSKLHLVTQRLNGSGAIIDTHIDRGKAVSAVLSDAVRLLKPVQGTVPNPPPRSWYPYIILWDAYVENKRNMDIMSQLYISEGTFNRTRKAAIGSVVQLLEEMEADCAERYQAAPAP